MVHQLAQSLQLRLVKSGTTFVTVFGCPGILKEILAVAGSSTCRLLKFSFLGRRGQLDPVAPGASLGPPNWEHFQPGVSWGSGKRLPFTCSWEVGLYLLHLPSVPHVSATVCSMGMHPAWAQMSSRSSREPWQIMVQSRRAATPLCCSLGQAMKARALLDKIYFLASAQSYHPSLMQVCSGRLVPITWLGMTLLHMSDKKWDEWVAVTSHFEVFQLWQNTWISIFQFCHLSSSKRSGKTSFPSWDLLVMALKLHCVLLVGVFPCHMWQ